jgi:hypothetical protein
VNEPERNTVHLLAYTYLRHAQYGNAITLLEALDLVSPGKPAVLRTLALAQERGGHPRMALDTLDRLAVAGGTDEIFHLLRARAFLGCGRRIEAAACMGAWAALKRASRARESAQ